MIPEFKRFSNLPALYDSLAEGDFPFNTVKI